MKGKPLTKIEKLSERLSALRQQRDEMASEERFFTKDVETLLKKIESTLLKLSRAEHRAGRKKLKPVSTKRAAELALYRTFKRPEFLAKPENRYCPVHAAGVMGAPRRVRTRDVHHRAGREGKLLLDQRYWLAVSRKGHRWIHDNVGEARKRGWIIYLP